MRIRYPKMIVSSWQATSMIAALGCLLSLCGCDGNDRESNEGAAEPTVVRETNVHGFDTDAEPVIREMSDGSVILHFEAMPPYFVEDAGIEFDMDEFRSEIQTVAGASVVQNDREVFLIATPTAETVEAVKNWLESYPKPDGG